tara:strand:- start:156 stop:431 length:276 start_codon:yes stop_codon:yes gene_type:complete
MAYAGSEICFCAPDSNGNPTCPPAISCQAAVNRGIMKMHEYYYTCECTKKYITIEGSEKNRLESVWKKNGLKWKWVLDNSDNHLYPVFSEE